jgi:UDP-N-acetylglucosamine 3-dehydrogenase
MRIKVGVIGAGGMGQHHIRVYSELENAELAGIADIDRKRAADLAAAYKTEAYTDYKELLKQNLDAISIVVPTLAHKEVALAAIDAGVNVLVEKPIADTVKNASEIIKLADKAGLKLMVGHTERFNPAVIKLKEIIDSGKLGKIVSISARRVGPYHPRIRDVGIIMDLGVHDIDVISYLYGLNVEEVYTIGAADIHPFEDHASIILRYKDERAGVIETNWLTPHKIRELTVIGLKGVSHIDYINQTLEIYNDEQVVNMEVEKGEPLKNELEYFIECLLKNKQPSPSGKEGEEVLRIAISAVNSYVNHKAINTKK